MVLSNFDICFLSIYFDDFCSITPSRCHNFTVLKLACFFFVMEIISNTRIVKMVLFKNLFYLK